MQARADGRIADLATSGVLSELWEELLVSRGEVWGRAVSYSMFPVIREGDRILVERVVPAKLRFGDIVVFKRSSEHVIHRVLGKRNVEGRLHVVEKGDANLAATLVPIDNVIGRVRVIERPSGASVVVSGPGRVLQYALAVYSLTNAALWRTLERGVRHSGFGHRTERCAAAFRGASLLPPALLLSAVGARYGRQTTASRQR